jgi:oxygen-independent coproporphyrinogen-3 oxidase
MITTRLRTSQGISLESVTSLFGEEMAVYLLENAAPHIANNWLMLEDGCLHLTLKGIMMSDTVMSDLIKIE